MRRYVTMEALYIGALVLLWLLIALVAHAQTWTHEMDSTARYYEAKYDLPHGIYHAFAAREAHEYDPFSQRAEKTYLHSKKVKAEAKAFARTHPGVSWLTEFLCRSNSYGLYQIMFEEFRRYHFAKLYPGDITLDDQDHTLALKFRDNLKRYHGNIRDAVSAWNHGYAKRGYDEYADGPVRGVMHFLHEFSY